MGLDEHVQEQVLLDYVLGELAAPERQSAAEHLRLCASCRRNLQELEFEQHELTEAIKADQFPSAARVSDARKHLTQWIDSYELEKARFSRRRRTLGPLGLLAAAASVLVCLGFLWLKTRPDTRQPDIQQVLAKVRLVAQSRPPGVLFQSYRVEISELQPVKRAKLSRLESWSDSTAQRFSSRWLDSQGTVRHAVWRPSVTDGVLTYDAANPVRIAARPLQAKSVSLWDLGESGLSCDDLAAAFVRWLETRSWTQVTLADGILSLTDQHGITVDLKREQTGEQELIELSARRQTRRGVAEMFLVLEARTYQPHSLRVRFQSGERISELTILRQELRQVSFASLDPGVFEPKLPGLSADVTSKRSNRGATRKMAEPSPPPSAASDREKSAVEVRIWFAVHQAGACLGQPIRIEGRPQNELVVTGIVPSAQMKDRILNELQKAELPLWVRQELKTSTEIRADQAPRTQVDDPDVVSPAEPRLPIEKELSAYFSAHPLPSRWAMPSQAAAQGIGEKISIFTTQVVNLADDTLDEAWALRRLAERFGEVGSLDAASETRLQRMVQDHLAALREDEQVFRQSLIPVLRALTEGESPTPGIGFERPAHTWQGACLRLFRIAERAHEELMGLFAVNFQQEPSPGQPEALTGPAKPAQALGRLLYSLEGMRLTIDIASGEVRHLREPGTASSVKSSRETPLP